MTAGIVGCIGFLLASFSQNITHVSISFGLIGFGMGIAFVSQLSAIPQYFDKYQRLALAFVPMGDSIGIVFPRLLVYLIDSYNWRGALFIVAGLLLQVVVCGAFIRSRKPRRRPKFENLLPFGILKDPLVLISEVASTLALGGFIIYISMINALMMDRGISKATSSSLVSFSALPNFIGKLIIPFIVHFCKLDVLIIMAILCAMETVAIIFATFADGVPFFMADLGLMLFTNGMQFPLDVIVVVHLFGVEKMPKVLAIAAIPMSIGMIALPKIAGYLADLYGLNMAFYFCAGCTGVPAISYILIYFYRMKKLRKRQDENDEAENIECS